jgi:hypothetical protein
MTRVSAQPKVDSPPPEAGLRTATTSRRALVWVVVVVAFLVVSSQASRVYWQHLGKFPPDTTPEGAYLRIASSVVDGNVRNAFAYLEDDAQHAAYSIRDYRKRASVRVAAAYPEPERSRLLEAYKAPAAADDGADVWVDMAYTRGYIGRLRRDLSGIASVERQGERATIETVRGTRYGFRRRENGIYGITLFTAELMAEAERAARDAEVVDKAAADYERGEKRP